jgi:hypothetical protein
MSTVHGIALMLAFKDAAQIGASPEPDPRACPDARNPFPFLRSSRRTTEGGWSEPSGPCSVIRVGSREASAARQPDSCSLA